MSQSIDKKELYSMRYPHGTVIELTAPIDDPYTPKPVGARFHVDFMDDCCQLHGHWEGGGSMAVDVEHDHFKVVTDER